MSKLKKNKDYIILNVRIPREYGDLKKYVNIQIMFLIRMKRILCMN